ncbi:FecCD family ABC transporter permease [Salipiger bermudensis]|uniref:FecCD family ABC transporter permease n=1 Tax=Salipiger bermudensis TaxID=344736 RepID=UPI001CD42A94|nr:iron ABC transporter permease [Salipiger bermudensis]MCA0964658.1 iron ABC transporter permease [Salipiger bermudensis]
MRLLGLLLLLALAGLLSLGVGARLTGLDDLRALTGTVETMGQAAVASRIPRSALAALAGAALGLAGAVMQGLTRNPLADPGILGVNAGAALAVVVALATIGMDSAQGYIVASILGASVSAVAVWIIASLGAGGATPLKLALAGAALSAALASLTTAVVLPRGDIAGLVQSWLVGGVGGATWDRITPVLPFLGAGALLALASAQNLNLLALGEDTATSLGTTVWKARSIAALGAVTLCGGATAVCGPIGFVGLVVPHLARLVFGVDYRRILPASMLMGAALLLLADVAGRVVARPGELDVGIVTAFVGAPVFIWIVRRRRVAAL